MAPFSLWRTAAQCITRPRLLVLLLGAAWRFRRRDWYRHAPFLPLPPEDYMRWRLYTAFGDERAQPDVDALEAYLRWTRKQRSS